MTTRSVVDVAVHTHWDRDRTLPRESALARLQAVMADVLVQLDSGALPSFALDGQTVAWRDLLAVAPPEMAARLQHHARAGRLVLGPWFVSADEFLVSGESLLRNLEFGQADAAAFAPAPRVGYLPRTCGHAAQMPQLLAQFAIDSAVLWRGADALHGEFRHDTQGCVLPDALGTRRPLKQAHQQLEDRLLGETEPLWAQLTPPGAGSAPAPALQRAWRLLIEQQSHHLIGGCSIDEVHAEMAQRLVQLGQQLDALRHSALLHGGLITDRRHASPGPDVFADDSRCTLFNPLPHARRGWWVVAVFLHGLRHAALKITTADGTELPHQLLRVEETAERVSPLDDDPERLPGQRYELAVQATLPGLGALALDISGNDKAPASDDGWSPCSEIENAAWHVALADDGRLQLTDRRSGRVMCDALGLLSELDAGDCHHFAPPPQPLEAEARRWWLQGARRSAGVQEMQLRIALHLPASLDAQRQGRHRKGVLCHGEMQLRLLGDEPALHAHLVWHNAARDQRTRLLLPWCDDGAASTFSDTAFAFTERPMRLAQSADEPSQGEGPAVLQPSLSTIVAGRLAVLHRALHEHEVVQREGQRSLALTLVRSVGWLSRGDLCTRGRGAGPDLATPDAQCLGQQVAEFQLLALRPTDAAHSALPAAQQMRRPPLLLRGHGARWAAAVDIGNPAVMTSCVRRLAGGVLELRLWNPTAEPQTLALDAGPWEAVFADGRPHPGPVNRVAPFAIHTLRQSALTPLGMTA